jgi:diaminopimelate decarboxylase
VSTKRVGGRRVAVTSGSVYDIKPSKASNNQPLQILKHPSAPRDEQSGDWLLTGFTCVEDDVMYRGWSGGLAVGDTCVFGNVGAYSNVLRPPFIKPAGPMVLVDRGSGDAGETLRRAETFEDVFGAYEL